MKKVTFLAVLFISVSHLTFGQAVEEPHNDYQYEGGMNFYQLDFRGRRYPENKLVIKNHFASGIYMRRTQGLNMFRAALDYFQEQVGDQRSWYVYHSAIRRTGQFKTGYQRLLLNTKFSPYLFSDLQMQYAEEKGIFRCEFCTYADYAFFAPASAGPEYKIIDATAGVKQGFGLRWQISKRLVVNAETSIDFALRFRKQENRKWDIDGDEISYSLLVLSLGTTF
jgi:hypothetical protein